MSATNGTASRTDWRSDHPVIRSVRGEGEPQGDRLLTAEQLADGWQLAGKTAVYRLTREGAIPTVKLGKKFYRYRLSDIEAFEAAGGVSE